MSVNFNSKIHVLGLQITYKNKNSKSMCGKFTLYSVTMILLIINKELSQESYTLNIKSLSIIARRYPVK
jgi:hypothetical protein